MFIRAYKVKASRMHETEQESQNQMVQRTDQPAVQEPRDRETVMVIRLPLLLTYPARVLAVFRVVYDNEMPGSPC